jgi:hypothetical protein
MKDAGEGLSARQSGQQNHGNLARNIIAVKVIDIFGRNTMTLMPGTVEKL